MCGRIAQSRAVADYLESIAWNSYSLPDALVPRYNVPPGTKPLALHCLAGNPAVTRLFWGYKPVWFKRAPVSNARLDTILDRKKSFWHGPFAHGRMLVPADGWYEWTGEKGSKQPWFIHSEGDEPIMMAAICAWRPGAEADAEHGMAIVTDDFAGGMVDIHDRRPVVLPPALARGWADPATTTEQARELMRPLCRLMHLAGTGCAPKLAIRSIKSRRRCIHNRNTIPSGEISWNSKNAN